MYQAPFKHFYRYTQKKKRSWQLCGSSYFLHQVDATEVALGSVAGAHHIGPKWESSPRPDPTLASPPDQAASLLVRCIACVAHVLNTWVSHMGVKVRLPAQSLHLEQSQGPPRLPQSQPLSRWNTFPRSLLLSPHQALGQALTQSLAFI